MSPLPQQNFELQLAEECLANFPIPLHKALKSIKVVVNILLNKTPTDSSLYFDYCLQLPDALQSKINSTVHWQDFSIENICFTDYLWHGSCLECFIGKTNVAEYIEINASPSGHYAVYHFDDYRQPNFMPPRRLILKDVSGQLTQQTANIHWQTQPTETYPSPNIQLPSLRRQFSFSLSQLPEVITAFDLIHPCVILYANNSEGKSTPLFFSVRHTYPADFHQQTHWQKAVFH